MRYLSIAVFAFFLLQSAYANGMSLKVLAWSHGLSDYGVEMASNSLDVTINIDVYNSKREMYFFLTQHEQRPYDILLLPRKEIDWMGGDGALLVKPEIRENATSITHYSLDHKYGIFAARDHLAAVWSGPTQPSTWQDFFEVVRHERLNVALTEKEDGVDALMLANAFSPNRFSESELMHVGKVFTELEWSRYGGGESPAIVSFANAVASGVDAYFPSKETRTTDYLFSVSTLSENSEMAWRVLEVLVSKSALTPLLYDGVSVFFEGKIHSPSKKVSSITATHSDVHASPRMTKLKAVLESSLDD